MNPKNLLLTGVMIAALSAGAGTAADKVHAERLTAAGAGSALQTVSTKTAGRKVAAPQSDAFLEALGAASDEQVYESLYGGRSLAGLAADNGADAARIVELQTAQLEDQLEMRFAKGEIDSDAYRQLKDELYGIVAASCGLEVQP